MSIIDEPVTGVTSFAAARQSRGLLASFESEGGNALNAVMGYAELLGTESVEHLPPEQREWLRHLLASCQQTKDLFDALLTAARAEAGELSLTFATERFARVVQHAVRGAAWEASEAGVSLRSIECMPELTVLGDVRTLDRVIRGLLRLLIGAAGPEGEIVVDASGVSETEVSLALQASGPHLQTCAPSQLLLRTWQKLLALHEGELSVDETGTRARLRLPRKADDAAR